MRLLSGGLNLVGKWGRSLENKQWWGIAQCTTDSRWNGNKWLCGKCLDSAHGSKIVLRLFVQRAHICWSHQYIRVPPANSCWCDIQTKQHQRRLANPVQSNITIEASVCSQVGSKALLPVGVVARRSCNDRQLE